ncbi:MAG: hypothetical protein EOP51_09210 [Sphingobacteriales bacterium]|nr:MAG: hypothetical protein EOP51_09210 [Sphingobacteriales bacterium]
MKSLIVASLLLLSGFVSFAKGDKDALNDKIAYGDLKFGASQAHYQKEFPDSMQKIGNYTYIFRPTFQDDKLVQLDIVTPPQDGKEFKENGAVALNTLVDGLTKQFGDPKHFWTIPAMGAFEVGRKELVADWEFGNKRINAYATKDYYKTYWGICSFSTVDK